MKVLRRELPSTRSHRLPGSCMVSGFQAAFFMCSVQPQPTESITLTRATAGDVEELSAFAARSFRDTYDGLMDGGDLDSYLAGAFTPAVQAADVADPATMVILARTPDLRLVGYLQTVAHDTHIELKRLYVDLAQKGGGLATLLMEEARNECRRRGLGSLRLTVWTRNPRAITFYHKMGFAVIGSETFMVGEDAQIDHVMEMVVPAAPSVAS